MVLNLGAETGEVLLAVVDAEAQRLLKKIAAGSEATRGPLIARLKHLGIVKHRLEYILGRPDPFPGPAAWGHPLRPESPWPFPIAPWTGKGKPTKKTAAALVAPALPTGRQQVRVRRKA
jgi:hypothetical protein